MKRMMTASWCEGAHIAFGQSLDGDAIVLRGWGEKAGATRIGFGECWGTVVPARYEINIATYIPAFGTTIFAGATLNNVWFNRDLKRQKNHLITRKGRRGANRACDLLPKLHWL